MKLQQRPRIRITEKQLFIAASFSFGALTVFLVIFGYFQTVAPMKAKANTGVVPSSDTIAVNMVVAPQTVSNLHESKGK